MRKIKGTVAVVLYTFYELLCSLPLGYKYTNYQSVIFLTITL